MKTTAFTGRDIRSGSKVNVACRRGIIESIEVIESDHVASAPERWIAPPLVDLQVNGYGGVDFQSDGLEVSDLLKAATRMRDDGCTRFFLTLITDEWPRLLARLRHLKALRSTSRLLQRAIAGWHIEGPFLSDREGFRGAHDPDWMRDPTERDLRELKEVSGNDRVLLTLAPERTGALQCIETARQLGMVVHLGHTNASAETLDAACAAGATGFTHLGNGCPQLLDRHDNILWRVLDRPDVRVTLIPDGLHVSPVLFRLIHRCIAPGRLAYVSDAMSAAGAPPGRYRLGATELEVGADQVVRKPGATNFAGSALRPAEGVRRAASMLDSRWQEAWTRFSDIPADWVGLESRLRPGDPAEFCLITSPTLDSFTQVDVVSPENTE